MDDPLKILREFQAADFLRAYERCADPTIRSLGNPAIVCAAFSAELGLKELLRQRQIKFKKEHSLINLLSLLPQAEVAAIRKELTAQWPDLDEQLANADNAFADWRYFFESPGPLRVNSKFLAALAGVVLRRVGGACLAV